MIYIMGWPIVDADDDHYLTSRPHRIPDDTRDKVLEMHSDESIPRQKIWKDAGISKQSYYNVIRDFGLEPVTKAGSLCCSGSPC